MKRILVRIFLVASFQAVSVLMSCRLVPHGLRLKLQGVYGRLGAQLWATMPLR